MSSTNTRSRRRRKRTPSNLFALTPVERTWNTLVMNSSTIITTIAVTNPASCVFAPAHGYELEGHTDTHAVR